MQPGNSWYRKLESSDSYISRRFSVLFSWVVLGFSLFSSKERRFIVFEGLIFMIPFFCSSGRALEIAVGVTFSAFATPLRLRVCPARMQKSRIISACSLVHFSLYMSILVNTCIL